MSFLSFGVYEHSKNVGENVEQLKFLGKLWRECKMVQSHQKTEFLKKKLQ